MNNLKLFFGGSFIFISLVIMVSISRSCQDCGSEEEAMEQFSKIGSVKEITLFQTFPGWESNLVKDTVLIRDDSTIRSIQKMILNRQVGSWDHPVAVWDVTLKAQMLNGSCVTLRISRIDNDRGKGMTHIYPGNKDCSFGYPEYSLFLGDYLEHITGYTGINYE